MQHQIALQPGLSLLSLRGIKLTQRPRQIEAGGDLPARAQPRHLDRRLIRADRLAQYLELFVESAQGDIVARQLRLQTQSRRRQVRGTGLREALLRVGAVAQRMPEIRLPRCRRAPLVRGLAKRRGAMRSAKETIHG